MLDIKCFAEHNNKLGTVAEFDICLRLRLRFSRSFGSSCICYGIIDLFPQKSVICADQNFHKPLSAGVHHIRLFQYGKHLRCTAQHIFCLGNNFFEKLVQIRYAVIRQFPRFLRAALGHRQYGSLFRLHNGLIRCFNSLFKSVCKGRHINFSDIPDPFGKSAEQLR